MSNGFMLLMAVLGALACIGIVMTLLEKFCKFVWGYAYGFRVPVDAVSQARNEIKEQVKAFRAMEDEPFITQPTKAATPMGNVSDAENALVDDTQDVMLDINGYDDRVSIKFGKKATVSARYYIGAKVVTRHVNIIDPRLRRRFGNRMQLPQVKVTDEWLHAKYDVIKTTRKEVDAMFKPYLQKETTEETPSMPAKEETIKPVSAVPEKVETPSPIPEPIAADVHDKARSKAKVISKGKLHWYGLSERVSGNKTFKHFKVDYIDDESGLLETAWGSDLKRALDSCGAKVGDQIELFKLGRKPVDSDNSDGNSRYMNRWSVTVLNGKTKQPARQKH